MRIRLRVRVRYLWRWYKKAPIRDGAVDITHQEARLPRGDPYAQEAEVVSVPMVSVDGQA